MPAPFDTHCLFSTVRNASGKPKLFGFLPPHGRRLDVDEEFSVFGNILDAIAHGNGGDRNVSQRWISSFEAAISRGDLLIIKTPNPIFEDTATGVTKMAEVTSGVLGIADPCWLSSGSVVDDIRGGEDFAGD